MTPLVLDSFEDDVDESYDPGLDHVEDQTDPYAMRASILGRALYAVGHAAAKHPPTRTIVVPFPVGVGEGDVSDKVYAVKRAYARSVSGWRLRALMAKPLSVRRTWGKQFSDEFGQSNYTKARHLLLAPYYDAYALSLLRSEPEMSLRDKQIMIQLGWHNAVYNRRGYVIYSQLRPSQLREAKFITRADCSGSVAGGSGAHARTRVAFTTTSYAVRSDGSRSAVWARYWARRVSRWRTSFAASSEVIRSSCAR